MDDWNNDSPWAFQMAEGSNKLGRSATWSKARTFRPLSYEIDQLEVEDDEQYIADDQDVLPGLASVRRHQSLVSRLPSTRLNQKPPLSFLHSRGNSEDLSSPELALDNTRRRSSTMTMGSSSSSGSASPKTNKSPIIGSTLHNFWSPTTDEIVQLSNGAVSPGAAVSSSDPTTSALEAQMAILQTADSQPSYTSPANVYVNQFAPPAKRQQSGILSPLNTALNGNQDGQTRAISPSDSRNETYRAPSSAFPYVRPIGPKQDSPLVARQSVLHRGAVTAAPGETSRTWQRQKSLIAGAAEFKPTSPSADFGHPQNEYNGNGVYTQQYVPTQQFIKVQSPVYQLPGQQPLWTSMPNARPDAFAVPPAFSPAPVPDVDVLARARGFNPIDFDCRPKHARFCVIKSFTEDDVHKSIKFGIWSSTKLGNQRLDRIFREGSSKGPIYLLYSVNGSGHFAGIAEMLTPIDENTTSKVWANEYKGIFKLRWIFVKDVPNAALRHLRLTNTQEQKPVTSSRDTQEIPYGVGLEMLRIITSYTAKTTLLQDMMYYDIQAQQRSLEEQIAGLRTTQATII